MRAPEPVRDERPLRVGGEWAPAEVLERLGPAESTREQLPKLLVAYAILQGSPRVYELIQRLETFGVPARARLGVMAKNAAFKSRQDELGAIHAELETGKRSFPVLKAKAQNDMRAVPNGLRTHDLGPLVRLTGAVVAATELLNKGNVAGIDIALGYAWGRPEFEFTCSWVDRLMPKASSDSVTVFEPDELGRVILVYQDGRLAYDPQASDLDDQAEY